MSSVDNSIEKVCIRDKLASISSHWAPKVVAQLNGQHLRLVKLKGEFVWHRHEQEDELFYVIHGQLIIELRDRHVVLDSGELLVIPKGIEHRPVAHEEVHVMLFEPASTVNTGDSPGELTVQDPERI